MNDNVKVWIETARGAYDNGSVKEALHATIRALEGLAWESKPSPTLSPPEEILRAARSAEGRCAALAMILGGKPSDHSLTLARFLDAAEDMGRHADESLPPDRRNALYAQLLVAALRLCGRIP